MRPSTTPSTPIPATALNPLTAPRTASPCAATIAARQRVFGIVFEGRRQMQRLGQGQAADLRVGHLWLAAGQRAGLVEGEHRELLGAAPALRHSSTRMPARAPWPVPTMIAVGVASPSAHGQAMTSTATAIDQRLGTARRPRPHHALKVASAMTHHRRHEDRRDAVGQALHRALPPCASPTSRMMPASSVSAPTPVALQRKAPWPLTVAANTLSPARLPTGKLSPVNIASLRLRVRHRPPRHRPVRSRPVAPGRSSPGISTSTAMSTHCPSRSTRAVFGCRRISDSMASEVRALARASSSLPSSTSVMTAAPPSK